jgi:hypothetical protein
MELTGSWINEWKKGEYFSHSIIPTNNVGGKKMEWNHDHFAATIEIIDSGKDHWWILKLVDACLMRNRILM